MLDITQVRDIAEEVVRAKLGTKLVEDVYAEPATDWTGDDALVVRVVLHPDAMSALTEGRKFSMAQRALGDRLLELGEMRFPLIRYATRADLRRMARARSKP